MSAAKINGALVAVTIAATLATAWLNWVLREEVSDLREQRRQLLRVDHTASTDKLLAEALELLEECARRLPPDEAKP